MLEKESAISLLMFLNVRRTVNIVTLIRDKLVSGITDDRVREKLLGTKGPNIVTAIETLRTNQVIKYRMRDMASMTTNESASDIVNTVKNRRSKKSRGKANPGHSRADDKHFPL